MKTIKDYLSIFQADYPGHYNYVISLVEKRDIESLSKLEAQLRPQRPCDVCTIDDGYYEGAGLQPSCRKCPDKDAVRDYAGKSKGFHALGAIGIYLRGNIEWAEEWYNEYS